MLILVFGTVISFSSCGDDDTPTPNDPTNNENNNGNNNNGSGTSNLTKMLSVEPINGKYLSNISNDYRYFGWDFSYSSNKLLSFNFYKGNKSTLTYTDGAYRKDDDKQRISKLETNQDGFITSLILDGFPRDTCNFYYSGRNLSKITSSYRDGNTSRLIKTYDFEWQNGNIVQIKITSTGIEHSEESTGQTTYKVFYDQMQNVHRQYPYMFTYYIVGNSTFAGMLNVGLLGDGPQLFPSALKEISEYQDPRTFVISPQTNSEGLITSESLYVVYNGTGELDTKVDFTYVDAN